MVGDRLKFPCSGAGFTDAIIIAASLPATRDKPLEPHAGGTFRAFDGALSGTILHIELKTLIVQTWRSANWPLMALDSVLTLTFWPEREGARIELVDINVADDDFAGVSQGWEKYYWTPWRAYLVDHK